MQRVGSEYGRGQALRSCLLVEAVAFVFLRASRHLSASFDIMKKYTGLERRRCYLALVLKKFSRCKDLLSVSLVPDMWLYGCTNRTLYVILGSVQSLL